MGRKPALDGSDFSLFWSAYPRKVAKAEAEKVFNALKPSKDLLNTILTALEHQKNRPDWKNPEKVKYIPHPARWLRGRRWEDESEATTPEPYMDIPDNPW